MIDARHAKIKILGRDFSIRTDGNEQYVKGIIDYVNHEARKVINQGSSVTTLDVMIKTTVKIAEELFQVKEENRQIKGWIDEESKRLIQYIDESFPGVAQK